AIGMACIDDDAGNDIAAVIIPRLDTANEQAIGFIVRAQDTHRLDEYLVARLFAPRHAVAQYLVEPFIVDRTAQAEPAMTDQEIMAFLELAARQPIGADDPSALIK